MNSIYSNGPIYGKVSDNSDPDGFGRVKVMLQVLGISEETDWIPVVNSYGGAEKGSFYIPEVDDQVVVGFLWDNPDNPIVLGGIWSNNQQPPKTEENTDCDLNQDGDNLLKFIKSKTGHRIIIDDKDEEEKIQVISGDGNTRLELLMGEKKINIETDKDINISADGKISIEEQDIELKSKKDIIFEADELIIETKGKDIEVKSNKNITGDSQSITIK